MLKSKWSAAAGLLSRALSAAVLGGMLVAVSTFAENEGPADKQAKVVALLPDAASGVPALTIDSSNALQFKALIVPELLQAIKDGKVEINTERALRFSFKPDDSWQTQSLSLPPNAKSLPRVRGIWGGASEEIARDKDAKERALRELWNIASVAASDHFLDYDLRLYELKDNRLLREVRAKLLRAYPRLVSEQDHTEQLFRELVRFTAPSQIAGLSWLTFRFLSADEDALWFYSMALHRARQLTGSNRSDPLMRSVVSLDDLLVWSGKVEVLDAEAELPALALAPVADQTLATLSSVHDGLCWSVGTDESTEMTKSVRNTWSNDSQKGGNLAPFQFPAPIIFTPRSLWRIEMTSKDPFSLYGRQIVYSDDETHLPIYKVVYDRAGHLWKTVIGIYGLAASADGKRRTSFPAFTVIFDHIVNEIAVIDYERVLSCDRFPENISLALFDPRKMGPVSGQAEENKSREKVKTTPVATPSPDVEDDGDAESH